jgi:serine/threonine protein kinase
VKIADFGFAKTIDQSLNLDTSLIGTPKLIAPELYDSKDRGIPSDIWSVGVILYFLATQKYPFESSISQQLVLTLEFLSSLKNNFRRT